MDVEMGPCPRHLLFEMRHQMTFTTQNDPCPTSRTGKVPPPAQSSSPEGCEAAHDSDMRSSEIHALGAGADAAREVPTSPNSAEQGYREGTSPHLPNLCHPLDVPEGLAPSRGAVPGSWWAPQPRVHPTQPLLVSRRL